MLRLSHHGPDEPPATDQQPTTPKGRLVPLMLRAKAAAGLFSLSEATWHRLSAAGKVPEPTRLGGAVLWNGDELAQWARAGCPDRAHWAAIRAASEGRR